MEKQRELNEEFVEIDLREYIMVLWKRKGIIIGILAAAILFSAIVSFAVLEPIYESEATIRLGTDSGSFSSREAASERLRSLSYFRRLNEDLELGLSDSQVDSLRGGLEIEQGEEENILHISYQGEEPEKTQLIIDNLVAILIEDSNQRFGEVRSRREEQIANIEQEMDNLELRLENREEQVEELLTEGDLTTTDKMVLSNYFTDKMQDLEDLKFDLQDRKHEREDKLLEMEELEVLNEALIPTSPVAPNKKLNLAIAGVLGIMLGVFIVFLAEFLEGMDFTEVKKDEAKRE
ncbi:Wzz/FepE/Etk N-terminal domain-containing protein [Fuchsiella alkaliacetigena]|uniref:Wzz/FepE/Etk N-terminal domain-containing protein n=1 Tax=Fuchsiella alkaliacetigena TaxID=957042 RepID=UPI002009FFC3|nr:Wzz/FepE/Etk N-terminal domain-containing protein [Fuchsiella alkaliacetigena]MCK8824317.1 Wzz/FepE/Etk N-terminal domain-containing protein [Fuchsiella alkaliacetigena]